MKISVIIPALNEERTIEECLKSVSEQTCRDFDIILIDPGSTDATAKIAKNYTDKIIHTHTLSPGPARNLGVRNSDAEIVAFTDADTVVPENWLEIIAKNFSDPRVVAVGGIFKPLNPRLLDKIMFKINSDLWYRFSAIFGFYQLGTPNCAYRRNIFLNAGGFNERMSMLEDTELSLRIKKYGKVIIDKNLYVYNSTRRFRQEGYFMVFMRYLGAYFNLFTGRLVKGKHFDTIEHKE